MDAKYSTVMGWNFSNNARLIIQVIWILFIYLLFFFFEKEVIWIKSSLKTINF